MLSRGRDLLLEPWHVNAWQQVLAVVPPIGAPLDPVVRSPADSRPTPCAVGHRLRGSSCVFARVVMGFSLHW